MDTVTNMFNINGRWTQFMTRRPRERLKSPRLGVGHGPPCSTDTMVTKGQVGRGAPRVPSAAEDIPGSHRASGTAYGKLSRAPWMPGSSSVTPRLPGPGRRRRRAAPYFLIVYPRLDGHGLRLVPVPVFEVVLDHAKDGDEDADDEYPVLCREFAEGYHAEPDYLQLVHILTSFQEELINDPGYWSRSRRRCHLDGIHREGQCPEPVVMCAPGVVEQDLP